jgi:hypothetical protein
MPQFLFVRRHKEASSTAALPAFGPDTGSDGHPTSSYDWLLLVACSAAIAHRVSRAVFRPAHCSLQPIGNSGADNAEGHKDLAERGCKHTTGIAFPVSAAYPPLLLATVQAARAPPANSLVAVQSGQTIC